MLFPLLCGKIKEKTTKRKTAGVYFRLKDILNRLKKLEARHVSEGMVTLICVEKGKRVKICVTNSEAQCMALKQGSAQMFGTQMPERVIVDVEIDADEDDGFIKALIDCNVTPEEVALFVEV